MECERWEREEEVAMDVDLSEVEQLQLLSEIKSARSTMVPPSSLESFGIPQDPSPATLPVSCEGVAPVIISCEGVTPVIIMRLYVQSYRKSGE